jgi:formylglycine-generating enzyme required for sulfatase activity
MRDVSIANPDDKLDERRNYNYADNINYHDGDVTSQIDALSGSSWLDPYDPSGGKPESSGMYNAPLKPGDKDPSLTSLINDKARVYKGGSWKDRAYYMGPGTRRFLDQRQSTAWIGFRCAMARVGSPVGLGSR